MTPRASERVAVQRVANGIVWLWRLVKGWLPRALSMASVVCSIVWASCGVDIWSKGQWALVLTVALAVASVVAEIFVQRPSYMKLSAKVEEAEARAAAKGQALERALTILLVRLGDYCELAGHSDRFSVYYFHDDRFIMLARNAKNPTYKRRGTRNHLAHQGAVGKAWASDHGQALVTMKTTPTSWAKAASKQGFTADDISKMKMRPATVAALRIEGEGRSVGVLVIESTTANRVSQEHLDMSSVSHIVAAIGELVAAFALLTPEGESLSTTTNVQNATWQPTPPRRAFGPQLSPVATAPQGALAD